VVSTRRGAMEVPKLKRTHMPLSEVTPVRRTPHVQCLVVVGAEVAEPGVPASGVVEAFEVGEDLHLELVSGGPGLAVDVPLNTMSAVSQDTEHRRSSLARAHDPRADRTTDLSSLITESEIPEQSHPRQPETASSRAIPGKVSVVLHLRNVPALARASRVVGSDQVLVHRQIVPRTRRRRSG
jgi:hypothetical protein